jgi:hypothetical protein
LAVLSPTAWSLRWTRRAHKHVSAAARWRSANPHSTHGLAGSHYAGLQFRGARDLLDDHL